MSAHYAPERESLGCSQKYLVLQFNRFGSGSILLDGIPETEYTIFVIRSFRCDETKAIFERIGSKKFRAIEKPALSRLLRLDGATTLKDLSSLHGNRLEALSGDRAGQHSIRINDQYRLCFVWGEKGPESVEIVDYHS